MPVVDSKTNVLKGGAFLVDESSLASVFIPELFSEEQLMIKSKVQDFA
jgi:hypothetical protein